MVARRTQNVSLPEAHATNPVDAFIGVWQISRMITLGSLSGLWTGLSKAIEGDATPTWRRRLILRMVGTPNGRGWGFIETRRLPSGEIQYRQHEESFEDWRNRQW